MRSLSALTGAVAFALGAAAAAGAPAQPLRVLAFTKTAGFRHDSIAAAVHALEAQPALSVDATEDAAVFTDERLERYDVVAFLLTTGDVLNEAQQAGFERFVRSGGGFVGVHSATDTEYDWPWYGRLVGAYFASHPAVQTAEITVVDDRDPSTGELPRRWQRTDEWYNFRASPRAQVHVLATLDEQSYDPGDGAMGDHPIAWEHAYDGGHAWYTAGGHTAAAWSERLFVAHVVGGLRYAAGLDPPAIEALSARVRQRRVAVSARIGGCRRCSATVTVDGRVLPATIRGGGVSVTTKPLRRGVHVLSLRVDNRVNGLSSTARRSIRVR